MHQRDTFPKDKCVDCGEPVHIGCSIVYPTQVDSNSFTPGGLKMTLDLNIKCLHCCFSNSKHNGGECASVNCQVSYKSIPFHQRCFLCNGLVHIECCMFIVGGVEAVDTSMECTFLCKSCSKNDSKKDGLSLKDTDTLSSRYHWIFSKNLFSHPASLFDDFSKLKVSGSINEKGGVKETNVCFLVDVFYLGIPIMWASQLQTEIALSTMEAEYVGLSMALRKVIPIIELLQELKERKFNIGTTKPIITCTVFEDNEGAATMARTPKMRPRTKHINIKYHHFNSFVDRDIIGIESIDSEEQPADMMTKPLNKATLMKHRARTMGW